MLQSKGLLTRKGRLGSRGAGVVVSPAVWGGGGAWVGAPAPAGEKKPAASTTEAPKTAPAKEAPKKDAPKTDAKAPPARPAAPPGPGMWACIDDFMKRTGKGLAESRLFGMRVRLHATEEIAWSDNIFYQDRNEEFIVDLDPDDDGIDAIPGIDQPRGRVNSFVNNFTIGGDLEMAVNANLIPLLGEGETTLKVFSAELQSVIYLTEPDGPDALNYSFHVDFPVFLNTMLRGLLPQGGKNSFYFRVEGDYQTTTDPLDVAKYEYSLSLPTLSAGGERRDFTRTEWYGKATLGWKGPRFDSKVSYRYYSFSVDDDSLDSADHIEEQFYGEIGWRPPSTEHRFYGFAEWTLYDFKDRGPGESSELLRNYNLWRVGPGWEGPLLTKKVRGRAEVYWLGQHILDNHVWPLPVADNGQYRPYDQYHGVGGMVRLAYHPFTTKATQLQAEYAREIQWSVVADHKIVDKASLTLTHPVNEKLTLEAIYNVEFTNVSEGESRIYQEAGFGLRYKLWAYTEAQFRYTFRYQTGHGEKSTIYADSLNRPFEVRSKSDFFANIVSVGIDVNF